MTTQHLRKAGIASAFLVALTTSLAGTSVLAQQSVEEFYRGNTINLIIGYSPGGNYDQYARLIARHLGNHIPGNPTIVPQNMPGAASLTAANYVYNVAPKDGTVIAAVTQSLAVNYAMGDTTLQLNPAEFGYIGNPVIDNNVVLTWHTSGIETVEDARQQRVTMGATGSAGASTSSQFPVIMNALLGTQFDVIVGYPGGNEVNFAMESGEVDGRGSWNWVGAKATAPQWIEEGLINVIVQIGLESDPDLDHVPLLMDLAENEEDREVLRLLSAPTHVGRPLFTTPDVPEERLQALRDAFDAMVEDPAFLEAAANENLEIRPVSGADLQQTVQDIVDTPSEIGARLAELLGVST